MFHSVPLNIKVRLPYGELIIALAAPSMVVLAVTVIGFVFAMPDASFTTNTVPVGLAGNTMLAGPATLTAK